MAPRWRKVLTDLFGNKIRTLLVILSIAVGVFAIGVVGSMYVIMIADLNADYQSANPHSGILYTMNFDDTILDAVRKVKGVEYAEGRGSVTTRLVAGEDKLIDLSITSVPDPEDFHIDRFKYVEPAQVVKLDKHDILIERSALSMQSFKIGDKITIELSDGRRRQMRVAGLVHDPTTFPYVMSGQLAAYVAPDEMTALGAEKDYSALYFTVSEQRDNEEHVRRVAQLIADKMEKGNKEVYYTFVYDPGKHPADSILQAIMALLGGLGLMAVFLSTFLVVNTINALLSQHIRQIGMMKAIGATSRQIFVMYLVLITLFGLLALLVAVPLSAALGYAGTQYLASVLNFEVAGFRIPLEVLLVQILVSVLVPLIASIFSVWQGTRLTVSAALSNYGLSGKIKRASQSVPVMAKLVNSITSVFNRPLLISLRNTFRRKGRLVLTLSTLTLGGAIFISVFNIQASLADEIDKTLGYFMSDLNISLNRAYRNEEISQFAESIKGVQKVEGWGFFTGQLYSPDKFNSMQVLIIAPPSDSTLIKPSLTSGRWLVSGDENAVVIGNHLIQRRPDLKVGDQITIKIRDKEIKWRIVGIYLMAGNTDTPIVYTNAEYLANVTNLVGQSFEFRALTNPNDAKSQETMGNAVKALLKEKGIQVGSVQTGATLRAQQLTSINVIIYLLLMMSILIALVGGLGLMGTMSMNVMERTREIGVMRAIGASDGAILRLVLVEGMLIGMISWGLGVLVAIPISKLLGDVVGLSLLTVPLRMVLSINGFVIWLMAVTVISALASFLPARNASRLTVREVLAYE